MSLLPLLFGGGGVVLAAVPTPDAGPPWSIDLCRDWQRIGIADGFEFVGVERFNELGEWTLSVPVAACEFGSRLVGGVPRRWKARDVNTIRVVRGRKVEFAGYVGGGSSGAGGMERVLSASGDRVTWSGPDAWDMLERRLAWPTPGNGITLGAGGWVTTWVDGHDVRSGQASAVLASFLIANIGKEAIGSRPVPGIVVADHGVGDDGEWSARLQTLSALATRIATDAGIRCRLSVRFAGETRIDIDAPVDRSAELTLTDQGDLTSVTIRRVPRSATVVFAGGQGELADRLFAVAFDEDDNPSGAGRREVFSDQSSLAAATELNASAAATLSSTGDSWSVNAEATDEASLMIAAIASDARPGDLVGLNVDGERHVIPITARRFELSAARQVVVPILGTAAPDELASLQRDVGGLAGRLDNAIA
jgi:hypothetical protein